MITVKMLKPYYIKSNAQHVRVVLAYQYFSVVINQDVYQFIPVEAKEIRLNRTNKKVENINARLDRKSTRLKSSHVAISYAVDCMEKKRPGDAALRYCN